MKQLDALRECRKREWYTDALYLQTWEERSGVRHCILTPTSIIGWGFTWKAALADADKQHARRSAARALLNHIDNITTDEFQRGGERKEREQLRSALDASSSQGVPDGAPPQAKKETP